MSLQEPYLPDRIGKDVLSMNVDMVEFIYEEYKKNSNPQVGDLKKILDTLLDYDNLIKEDYALIIQKVNEELGPEEVRKQILSLKKYCLEHRRFQFPKISKGFRNAVFVLFFLGSIGGGIAYKWNDIIEYKTEWLKKREMEKEKELSALIFSMQNQGYSRILEGSHEHDLLMKFSKYFDNEGLYESPDGSDIYSLGDNKYLISFGSEEKYELEFMGTDGFVFYKILKYGTKIDVSSGRSTNEYDVSSKVIKKELKIDPSEIISRIPNLDQVTE